MILVLNWTHVLKRPIQHFLDVLLFVFCLFLYLGSEIPTLFYACFLKYMRHTLCAVLLIPKQKL